MDAPGLVDLLDALDDLGAAYRLDGGWADQLTMHEGYEPRATDRTDVRLLAERFDLPPPGWAR